MCIRDSFQGMEISTPRGCAGGAAPPSANLGPPRISETSRARRLKFYTQLDRTKCGLRAWQFSARVRPGGGQAADREASSCNAPQLPRFLVIFILWQIKRLRLIRFTLISAISRSFYSTQIYSYIVKISALNFFVCCVSQVLKKASWRNAVLS